MTTTSPTTVHLGRDGVLKLQSPSHTDPVPDGELALIGLEFFDVKRLTSKMEKTNEGILKLELGKGQGLALGWERPKKGSLVQPLRFQNQLLYVGEVREGIDLSATVIEFDVDKDKALEKSATSLGLASSVAVFSGVGTLVSAGLAFVSKIVSFFGKKKTDDLELAWRSTLGEWSADGPAVTLRQGRYTIVKDETPDTTSPPYDLTVGLRVGALKPLAKDKKKARVAVRLADIEVTTRKPGELDKRELLLELSLGNGKNAVSASLGGRIQRDGTVILDDVVGVRDWVLYRGPWVHGVPYIVAGYLVKKGKVLQALEGLIGGAKDFALTFAEGDDQKAEEKRIKAAGGALQSARTLALETISSKEPLGLRSGILVGDSAWEPDGDGDDGWTSMIHRLELDGDDGDGCAVKVALTDDPQVTVKLCFDVRRLPDSEG